MEHHHHSTYPTAAGQTVTTSTAAKWVYRDMTHSNVPSPVIFRTKSGKDFQFKDLESDAHYSFPCRCGCGDTFAGYGRDIKFAAKIGFQTPSLVSETSAEVAATRMEFAMKVRPFVSDRYIQKAIFKLTDDEIDQMAEQKVLEGKVDPVIQHGGGADGNEPPEVGVTVWSKVTGQGPFTVMDFTMAKIKVNDGELAQIHQTYCAVLREKSGRYITVPVGDLVKRPPESDRSRGVYKTNTAPPTDTKTSVNFETVATILIGWSALAILALLFVTNYIVV